MTPEERAMQESEQMPPDQQREDFAGEAVRPLTIDPGLDASGLGTPSALSVEAAPADVLEAAIPEDGGMMEAVTETTDWGESGDAVQLGSTLPARGDSAPDTSELQIESRRQDFWQQQLAFMAEQSERAKEAQARDWDFECLAGCYISEHEGKLANNPRLKYLANVPAEQKQMLVGVEYAQRLQKSPYEVIQHYIDHAETAEDARRMEQQLGQCNTKEKAYKMLGGLFRGDCIHQQEKINKLEALEEAQIAEYERVDQKFQEGQELTPEEQATHASITEFTPSQYEKLRQMQAILNEEDGVPSYSQLRRMAEIADGDVRLMAYPQQQIAETMKRDRLESWTAFTNSWRNAFRNLKQRHYDDSWTQKRLEQFSSVDNFVKQRVEDVESVKGFGETVVDTLGMVGEAGKIFADYAMMPLIGKEDAERRIQYHDQRMDELNKSANAAYDKTPFAQELEQAIGVNDSPEVSAFLGMSQQSLYSGLTGAEEELYSGSGFFNSLYGIGKVLWQFPAQLAEGAVNYTVGLPSGIGHSMRMGFAGEMARAVDDWGDRISNVRYIPFEDKKAAAKDGVSAFLTENLGGYVGFRVLNTLGPLKKALFSGGKTSYALALKQSARAASVEAARHPGAAIAKSMLQSYLTFEWALPAGEALLGETLQLATNGSDRTHAIGDYLTSLENKPKEEYAAMALTFLGLSALHVGRNARQRGKAKEFADKYRAQTQYQRSVNKWLDQREAEDSARTERMRQLSEKYFSKDTCDTLFRGDVESAMEALVAEQVKNPAAFLKKLESIGHEYAEGEAVRAAVESGAALHVLKRAGYTEASAMEGGKVRLKFQTLTAEGKPETQHVDWDSNELTAFLQARTLSHITDAALDLQARVRGEQLRQTKGSDNTLWFHLGDFPEALRKQLPLQELDSGELSIGTLETISKYANQHLKETFGDANIPMSALRNLGESGKERVQGDKKLIIPSFQTRLDNGTMVGYYALGKISERDILHEMLERGVRNAVDKNSGNLQQILGALVEIQQQLPRVNKGRGAQLLPDKPLESMGHLEAVEGLSKLAEMDIVARGGVYGLSPRAQSAVNYCMRSLGGTDLVTKLGNAARGIIERSGEAGKDGYRLVQEALQRAGMEIGERYRELEQQGYEQAREALRVVLDKEERPEPLPAKTEPAKPLTPQAFREATSNDAESTTIKHDIPAEETLCGKSIPAEARADAPFVHPETGELLPSIGDEVKDGFDGSKGIPSLGRGLTGGKYVETGRGTVRGAMAVKDIQHPTASTPEIVLKAARHNDGNTSITVYRLKGGKMIAVDGYDLLQQASGGKYVEVEVKDVEGTRGLAEARKAHEEYLMRIGALDKEAIKEQATAREMNRSEAESQRLVPRDRNGQVEPAAREAWEEMGPTFFARKRSRGSDYSTDAERRFARAIDRFIKQSSRDLHDLICGKDHYCVTETQLREQYEKAHPGEKYDKTRAAADIRQRIDEALHLLQGHANALREAMRKLHGEEIAHDGTSAWIEAIRSWNHGETVKEPPFGLSRQTYDLLNDSGRSDILRAQTLAQVIVNHMSDYLKQALSRDRGALVDVQLKRLDRIAAQMDPENQEQVSPQKRHGLTSLSAWKLYQEARRIMELGPDQLESELERAQREYDSAVRENAPADSIREAQRKLQLLNGYGDLKNRSLDDIINACDMLVNEMYGGRDSMNARLGDYDACVQWIRERIASAALIKNGGKKIDYTDQAKQQQAQTSHSIMRHLRSLYNMFQRLEKHSGGAAGAFLRDWIDLMSEGERLAMYDRVSTQRAFKKACSDSGLTYKDINRWNQITKSGIKLEYGYKTMQPVEPFRLTSEQLNSLRDEALREQKRAEAGSDYYPSEAAFARAFAELKADEEAGKYREDYLLKEPAQRDYQLGTDNWELSQSQALYVLLMADQRMGREHLEKHGIDSRVLAELEDFVSPELKRLGHWMRDYLNGNGLKEIYEARTGCPFHFEENYFPFRFQLPKAESDARSGMQETPLNTGYANYSFLFRRVPHEWKPDTTCSAFNVFFETQEAVRNYKYKSQFCELVHDTLRANDTMAYFTKLVGADDAALIVQDVQHFAGNFAPVPESAKARFSLGWFLNRAKAVAYLIGPLSTMVRNSTAWLNVYSDPYFRTMKGKMHMLTFLLRGLAESGMHGLNYISEHGPFKFFQGLQDLQQDTAPMTIIGMFRHPLFQARLSPNLAARVAQLRPGQSYRLTTALRDLCLEAGVNFADVLGNVVTHSFLYNHAWREAKANGLTDSEARQEAELRLQKNLLRGTQPITAAGKASAVLGMPDPSIMSEMFCKSELVNKLCQAFSLYKQARDGNRGLTGYLKGMGEFYAYLLPFSTSEQVINSAFTYYAASVDMQSQSKQERFFWNNAIAAASLVPTLDLNAYVGYAILLINEQLPEKYQMATKATSGQVADIQQWKDTVDDVRYLFQRGDMDANTWWSASEVLRVMSIGAEFLSDRNAAARVGADVVQLVNGIFNAGRPVARRYKTKRKKRD